MKRNKQNLDDRPGAAGCNEFGIKKPLSYSPAPLLRRLVNLGVVLEPGPLFRRLHFRHRRRQRRLPVVHVPDRAHVQVRLGRFAEVDL